MIRQKLHPARQGEFPTRQSNLADVPRRSQKLRALSSATWVGNPGEDRPRMDPAFAALMQKRCYQIHKVGELCAGKLMQITQQHFLVLYLLTC